METAKAEINVHINNTPEGVMEYIADVRNRPLFLSVLKSVTDIKGDPSAVGTSWKWTAAGLGMEFEGVGRCVEYKPGQLYVSKTEGGIEGAVTYRVQREAQGTKLTIESEYGIPGKISSRLPVQKVVELLTRTEAERVGESLKVILDR